MVSDHSGFYNISYHKIHGKRFFQLTAATLTASLTGDVESVAYVPHGSPLLPPDSLLAAEFNTNTLSAYAVNSTGDPVPGTRQPFLQQYQPDGLTFDPVTGDLLFTDNNNRQLGVVSGFKHP